MTKIQIRKVNGVPMARPCNPFEKYPTMPIILGAPETEGDEWLKFEQSVTEHEAPGCEEGEAEGTLVWQWKHPFDRDVKDWKDEANKDEFTTHEYSVANGYETRQIWRTVPPPEKVEVKESKSLIIESALIHEIPAISTRTGISTEWLAVWYEVEMFYGDVQKKETREDLLLRLQTQYKLTAI